MKIKRWRQQRRVSIPSGDSVSIWRGSQADLELTRQERHKTFMRKNFKNNDALKYINGTKITKSFRNDTISTAQMPDREIDPNILQ
jgi:hypothetical protein